MLHVIMQRGGSLIFLPLVLMVMIGSTILSNPLHAEVDELPPLDVQVFRELVPGDHAAVGRTIEFHGSKISLEREPILSSANIAQPHEFRKFDAEILSLKIEDPIALKEINTMVGSNVHVAIFINGALFSITTVKTSITRDMWSSGNIVAPRK